MILLKILLLTCLFLVGNCAVGTLLLALLKGRKRNNDSNVVSTPKTLLAGTGFLFLVFAVLTYLVINREGTFATLYRIFLVSYVGILAGSVLLLFGVKTFRRMILFRFSLLKSKDYWKAKRLWLVLFALMAVTFYVHRPYLESRFDLPERMSTLNNNGMFYGVNPLTGETAVELPKAGQWSEGVVPAFYLFFSKLFGVPTYRMLFQAVPLWTLCLCMSAYYLIGRALFDKKKLRYFMICFTMFTLCGNGAYMNPSYGLLHYAYEESTLISSVVFPCIFALILELTKKVYTKKQE